MPKKAALRGGSLAFEGKGWQGYSGRVPDGERTKSDGVRTGRE
jgi:hypothetical protein